MFASKVKLLLEVLLKSEALVHELGHACHFPHVTPMKQFPHVTPMMQFPHVTLMKQVPHVTPMKQFPHVTPMKQFPNKATLLI